MQFSHGLVMKVLSKKAVAGISEYFARTLGKGIPPEALDAWRLALDPLSDRQATDAAVELVRRKTDTFPVVPGALIALAEERVLETQEEGPLFERVCAKRGLDYEFEVTLSRRVKRVALACEGIAALPGGDDGKR